ncbi:WPP domain-associated protein [Platanthera guangdongensis]|uniref:WPP domain-associated protein n=1 Tax=Platanthera guangdongensis TaxID=2320717 RepID=A0ABR2LHL1_9ASPA
MRYRMVTDTIIKGMVNAIEDECAETIFMNEEEVLNLVNKFPNHDAISTDTFMFNQCLSTHEMSTHPSAVVSSYRTPAFERELEQDIPINSSALLLQNIIADLHHECETNILGQKTFMIDLMQKWQKKCKELANLRHELDHLYKSLLDPGLMFPHINHEVLEERNTLKRKDLVQRKSTGSNIKFHDDHNLYANEKIDDSEQPIFSDSPQLMCMPKEELINYFKTEMIKMNRQHDATLQQKTEELFILKREFLKEKGSGHVNLKRDKEVELVRNMIAEIVSNLDDILLENENLSTIRDDEGLCSLREKLDAMFLENRRLVYLLAAKKKETPPDSSKVSGTTNNLPNLFVGGEDIDQIEKLQEDIEVLKFEMSIKDVINKSSLQELYGEFGDSVEGMEMETKIYQCTCSFILGEVVRDALSMVNSGMLKCFEERNDVSEKLLVMQKALLVEVEENKMLKKQIESSSNLLKSKAILESDLEAALVRLSDQRDSISGEHDALRDRVIKQELIMAESKKEFDLINCTLSKHVCQIHQHQAEIDIINQNFKSVSVALEDAEKQKSILQAELLDVEAKLASEVKMMKEHRKLVESILIFMSKLQYKVECKIEHNESRLKALSCRCHVLSKQANLVKKRVLSNKEAFERKCEDLQKAEIEVDLLGDEVDNLASLLGNIYFILEHYSPVLQCYPGVMEALKLIRRKMKVEAGEEC